MKKGFFAIFDRKLYALEEPSDIVATTEDIMNSTSQKLNTSTFGLDIMLSNMKEDVSSNAETYHRAVHLIESERIQKIPKLHGIYRLELDYQLYDKNNTRVLDEGILTETVNALNTMLPLGLDARTNETVYRLVKKISHQFQIVYQSEMPYGIMNERPERVILYINRIQVKQLYMREEVVVGKYERKGNVGDTFSAPMGTPYYDTVCAPIHDKRVTFQEDYLTIYDSYKSGITFNPFVIGKNITTIQFNIEMLLNNYFLTASENDIMNVVKRMSHEHKPVDGWVPPKFDEEDKKHHHCHRPEGKPPHHHPDHDGYHPLPEHDCGRPHKEDCLVRGYKWTEHTPKIKQIPEEFYPIIYVPHQKLGIINVYEASSGDMLGMICRDIDGAENTMSQLYRNIMIDICDKQMQEIRFMPSKRMNPQFSYTDFVPEKQDAIIVDTVTAINTVIANNLAVGEPTKLYIKKDIDLTEAEPIRIPENSDVTIVLEGKLTTIDKNRIEVAPNAKLTINGGEILTHGTGALSAILVDSGNVTIDGTTITTESPEKKGYMYGIYAKNDSVVKILNSTITTEIGSCIGTNNLTGNADFTISKSTLKSDGYAVYIATQSIVRVIDSAVKGIFARMGTIEISGESKVWQKIEEERLEDIGATYTRTGSILLGEGIVGYMGTYDTEKDDLKITIKDNSDVDGWTKSAMGIYRIDTKKYSNVTITMPSDALFTHSLNDPAFKAYTHKDIEDAVIKASGKLYTPVEVETLVVIDTMPPRALMSAE